MSSYYPSFNYLGFNSREKGLVISHFDADQGEHETFLGMEPIYTESADGTRRHDYGAKYNNVASFRITAIKPDESDLSVAEIREHLKWLTGSRQNSPLELVEHFSEEFTSDGGSVDFELINACDRVFQIYVKDTLLATNEWSYNKTTNIVTLTNAPTKGATIKISYGRIKYYFIGRITNAWQYKMDARTIGLIFEFTSTSPWAYSAKQTVSTLVGNPTTIAINNDTDDLYGYTSMNVVLNNTRRNLMENSKPLFVNEHGFDASGYETMGKVTEEDEGVRIVNTESNTRMYFGNYFSATSGQSYTVSFKYKLYSGESPVQIQAIYMDSNWQGGIYFATSEHSQTYIQLDNGWKWIQATFTTPNVEGIAFVRFALRSGLDYKSYTCDFSIKEPQVELGTKATAWTYAFNDPELDSLKIINSATKDVTTITNIAANEVITLSNNMMITSDKPNRVFGNDFNFVFPRLVAGENNFVIQGTGNIIFEYVYAIKIGDCSMDINVISDPIYDDDGHIQLDTLPWNRIVDTPTTYQGYGITNVYSKAEVDALVAGIEIDENELFRMLIEELN